MVRNEELLQVVDEAVQECLAAAGIDGPPVDPAEVAQALGLAAQWDAALGGRGERRTVGGRSVILIRPDERDERECFALAHEIGEELSNRIAERLDVCVDSERWREDLANLFAGRLLCPFGWLQEITSTGGVDLRNLKEVFATASHEVISRQLIWLPVPSVITIIDNGTIRTRMGNVAHTRRLTPGEDRVWRGCHESGEDIDHAAGLLRVQAWAIHEQGWRREILRTTRLDE